MTFRPAPLRAAAALAAGFVVVRVVYRVLFHGAEGTGVVLLDLPAIRLAPPFGHVEILGPVTADGLWSAAVSAVPVAAVILAFGVLNALVDLPRLLARGARSGPFQGLARALTVAWATLPALVTAARSTRQAQRLRGERAGVRILAPVLEHTLERATAVAATLELRGYGGRAAEGDCARPVVLADVRAGFGARRDVRVDRLTLGPGELVALSGATGSGKSTLLRALSGLHTHVDGGTLSGRMEVVGCDRALTAPRDTARTVGVVLQVPRQAFATDRVADEIGLSLELRGLAPVLRDARVREVAGRVGIDGLLGRGVSELSAGEATLVAIAAAIVDHPVLLLVDEPLADLDVAARERIVALLGALAHEAGMCVVVAEHRTEEFRAVADRWLHVAPGGEIVDGGEIVGGDDVVTAPVRAPLSAMRSGPGTASPTTERGALTDRPALAVEAITVRHGRRVAVDAATLRVRAGEIVAITGPNGAGKSTLLGALSREAGTALVPDASDDLFVRDTVDAECRREDRRARTPGATATRFAALLGMSADDPSLRQRLERHPRDLSVGERRCLAIALQTARRPRVLLVDEPTRGLDPEARDLVLGALAAQSDAGTAVVIATHDAAFAAALADRSLSMREGVLSGPVAAASAIRATSALRPSASDVPRATPIPAATEPTEPTDASAPTAPTAPTADHAGPAATHTTHQPARAAGTRRGWRAAGLVAANLAAAAAFLWPLAASAVPAQAQAAVPYIALSLSPIAAVLVFAALDASVRSAHTLALLAVLAAVGAAVRVASTGVGGVEALFVLLILAGRAFGARFGMLLGAAAIALSALMWGGVGPWLPFQMFACGWVASGAGLLPRGVRGWREIAMLCAYGIASSYLFGLVMNMWFWPFAVGAGTSISYVPGGPIGENVTHFLVYSLVTSTATWDTLRAITTVVGLVLVGRAMLSSLRRVKPVAPRGPAQMRRHRAHALHTVVDAQ